jgi:membrane-associated protease RseP (regulator of RpoE activity)
MSSPRHLWSGDWELDSTAARAELDRRRAQSDEPVGTPPETPSPPARPSVAARVLAALRALRPADTRERAAAARERWGWELKVSALIALGILLTAAAAYGLTAIVVASDNQNAAAVNRAHSWLGIDVAGSPSGILITNVVPRSPAQSAGLRPGDRITAINTQPVGTVDGVSAALRALQPGDIVAVQFSRGLVSYTTQATLSSRSSSGP